MKSSATSQTLESFHFNCRYHPPTSSMWTPTADHPPSRRSGPRSPATAHTGQIRKAACKAATHVARLDHVKRHTGQIWGRFQAEFSGAPEAVGYRDVSRFIETSADERRIIGTAINGVLRTEQFTHGCIAIFNWCVLRARVNAHRKACRSMAMELQRQG